MITINLYDYKRLVRDVSIQKSLTWVTMGVTVSVLLCFMIWMFQNILIGGMESDLAEVEAEVAAATPDYNVVQKKKAQQKKYVEIITGIDKLRSSQAHTTEFLEDVGRAVPEGVWLKSVQQMNMEEIIKDEVPFLFIPYGDKKKMKNLNAKESEDKFIGLKGVASTDQPIVHFLEQIRALPYIDAVVLHESTREWIENVAVHEFAIYCHFLKPKPAA